MTQSENNNARPDVEKIIEKIRDDIRSAEAAVPENTGAILRTENNISGNLSQANQQCIVGQIKSGGLKGLLLKCLYRPLRPLTAEINRFHASVVGVLNRLVKILEGNDPVETGTMLDRTRKRIELLERLGRRLDALDDLRIEERLASLEKQLSGLKEKDRT